MDSKEREQRFDAILFSLAEQHPQGVLDVGVENLLKKRIRFQFLNNFIFSFFIVSVVANHCWISGPQNRLFHRMRWK
jgi:hypothetical protein